VIGTPADRDALARIPNRDQEVVRLKTILNYSALSGGLDVLRFDAQRLVDLRPGSCLRLNTTYTHMTPALSVCSDLASGVGCGEQ